MNSQKYACNWVLTRSEACASIFLNKHGLPFHDVAYTYFRHFTPLLHPWKKIVAWALVDLHNGKLFSSKNRFSRTSEAVNEYKKGETDGEPHHAGRNSASFGEVQLGSALWKGHRESFSGCRSLRESSCCFQSASRKEGIHLVYVANERTGD